MSQTETVNFTCRMPKSLVDQLDRLAKRELSSRNRELTIAARAHVDAGERKRDTLPPAPLAALSPAQFARGLGDKQRP